MQIGEIDILDEIRMRRWARQNYVPKEVRPGAWHPTILDEMRRKDSEFSKMPQPVDHQPTLHVRGGGRLTSLASSPSA